MESIVAMSRLIGQSRFAVSSLPAKTQLDLHVDADDFSRHVQDVFWYENNLDGLASFVHESFRKAVEIARDKHPAARAAYEDLLEDERDMNRLFIRDLSEEVQALGLSIVRTGGREPKARLRPSEVTKLARTIHERYVAARRASGYTFGREFDLERRTDPQLLPWNESTEKRRRQVRHLIEAIPELLQRADCELVR